MSQIEQHRQAIVRACGVPGSTIVEPRDLIGLGVWDSDWPSIKFVSRERKMLVNGYVDEAEFAALWPAQVPARDDGPAKGGSDG